MNPDKNNSNLKSVWYIILAIVVVILLVFAFKGGDDNTMNGTESSTSTTSNTSGNNSGTNNSGSNGTGSNGSGLAGNVATIPTDAQITALMNTAKVRVPGTATDVALSSGRAEYTSGAVKGTIQLGSILGKFPTTDGYDVLVVLNMTNDKNVTSNNVALFHVKDNSLLYTSTVPVGTNVTIRSVSAKVDQAYSNVNPAPTIFNAATGYQVTINYLDRKGNESATTTPSVSKDITAQVKNHVITR